MASGSTIGGSVKTYRIVLLSTSTPYQITSTTTVANTAPFLPADKGVTLIFQNQSTAAGNIWVGGSDVAPALTATSTVAGVTIGAIAIAQNGIYQIQPRHGASAIQANDWYVVSTSSNSICVAQLIKMV